MKRLALLATVLTATAAAVLVGATPAAAAVELNCTTSTYPIPDPFNGTHTASYVGSYWTLGGTWRVWHFTSNYGSGNIYNGAGAARCDASGHQLSWTDLTRETLTASDHPKCGTTSYTVGDDSYTYLGSRYNNGDRFRYWGQTIQSGMILFRGVAAVRCD